MKLITISGLDGSGKSTQVQLLKEYLESQNKRVFYFHAIEFGIAKKITCFLETSFPIGNEVSKKEKSIAKANFFQIILRRIFLMIDIWRFSLLSNKLLNKKYDYILSDRYFYDSIINIEYLSCQNRHLMSNWTSNVQVIQPDLAIYLQADPDIIMSRERKPDQGIEYLKKKKELYDSKASEWNLKIVDGNRTKEEIFTEIKKIIP